jgi:pimeloyl-ACP methyl ester carboxylesterase
MRTHRPWRLGGWLMALGLASGPGCLSFLHPVAAPCPDSVEACQAMPRCCRGHVYVFIMNGIDPTDCGNLAGFCDCLHKLGFLKTYCGEMYHFWWFEKEIRRLHKEDPDGRFVLVGYSVGGEVLRRLACKVNDAEVAVDLMVYMDCTTVSAAPDKQPTNVERTINIWSDGNLGKGKYLEGAENIHLPDAWPLGAPSSVATQQLLAHELAEVAARVPVPAAEELPPPVVPETAPTPRPVMPPIAAARDEWDFLKPLGQADQWPELPDKRDEATAPPEKGMPAKTVSRPKSKSSEREQE